MILFILAAWFVPGDEVEAIRDHVKAHYFDGMYTAHDREALRSGFHPKFRMVVWWEGELTVSERDEWIGKVMSHPAPDEKKAASYELEVPVVWVKGDAAAVRIEIFRDGKPRYTDFFTLYRIDGRWQVLAKTFHFHKSGGSKDRPSEPHRRAIEDLIEARYLAGFSRGFSGESIRKGFHDAFRMVTWWENQLTTKDRETWIAKLESHGGSTPEHRAKWSWRVTDIELAGDAAMARIELAHDGHLMFTDFFLLYRVQSGWQVVEKSFDYIPKSK